MKINEPGRGAAEPEQTISQTATESEATEGGQRQGQNQGQTEGHLDGHMEGHTVSVPRRAPNALLQDRILLALRRDDPLESVSDLAQLLTANRPSVSRAINNLHRQGFVSKENRRWVLRDKGQEEAKRLREQMPEKVQRITVATEKALSQQTSLLKIMNFLQADEIKRICEHVTQFLAQAEARELSENTEAVLKARSVLSEIKGVQERQQSALKEIEGLSSEILRQIWDSNWDPSEDPLTDVQQKDPRKKDPQFLLVLAMYAVLNDGYRRKWDHSKAAVGQEQQQDDPAAYQNKSGVFSVPDLVSLKVLPSHEGWVYGPTWDAPRPTVEVLTATYDISDSTAERISVFNVFEQFDDPAQAVALLFQVQQQWRPIAERIFERGWQHRLLHRAERIFTHSIAHGWIQMHQVSEELERLTNQHPQSTQQSTRPRKAASERPPNLRPSSMAVVASEVRQEVREARRHLHWLFLRQQWLQIWSELDARFRKTLRSSPETSRTKATNWNALIKPAELHKVSELLFKALKQRRPDDSVPPHFEVLGVWYVLVLSQCGASNEDLNRIRRRPSDGSSDGSLRAWSEIVEKKWRYQERKMVLRV